MAVYPRPFSSTFGFAGPVMARLNEVAVGRRDLPSLDERSPLLPRSSPHAASGRRRAPGGSRGQVGVDGGGGGGGRGGGSRGLQVERR